MIKSQTTVPFGNWRGTVTLYPQKFKHTLKMLIKNFSLLPEVAMLGIFSRVFKFEESEKYSPTKSVQYILYISKT